MALSWATRGAGATEVTGLSRIAGWIAPPPAVHQSYKNLDGLRLIASVGIVLFHYNIYLSQVFPATGPFTRQFPLFVDLFFVISGIVIAMVYGGRLNTGRRYANFLSLRLARLYPLHFATLMFYVVIGCFVLADAAQVINPERYNFDDLVPNLLLIHAWGFGEGFSFNYVSWSVSAEFFCYLVFPVLLWVIQGSVVWGAVAVALISLFATLVTFASLEAFAQPPEYNATFVLRAVVGFSFGVYTYLHRAVWVRFVSDRAIRVLGNAAFFVMVAVLMSDLPEAVSHVLVALAVFACFVADEKGVALVPAWKGFSGLSELTYSTYMLHTVVATPVVSFIFPHLFGPSPASVVASLIAALFGTYVLSVLTYRFLEDPARKAWRRASDRWILRPVQPVAKVAAE